jgi:hypothetical protein
MCECIGYNPGTECSNGVVEEPEEECELPDTNDNNYCGQTMEGSCVGPKIEGRDEFGNCNGNCLCVEDLFTSECNIATCGALCEDGNMGGETCESILGADYTGVLDCSLDDCTFDTSGCVPPGVDTYLSCAGEELCQETECPSGEGCEDECTDDNYCIMGSDRLLAHYKFDNNANDELGTHNGTISGVTFITGLDGMAADFSANDDYISIDSNLLGYYDSFTVAGWILPDEDNFDNARILFKRGEVFPYNDSKPDRGFLSQLYYNNPVRLFFYQSVDGLMQNTNTNYDFPQDGFWHHIATTYVYSAGNSIMTIYIDGEPVETRTISGVIDYPATVDDFFFGKKRSGDGYAGLMDEFKIYNYELSEGEVTMLYEELRPCTVPYAGMVLTTDTTFCPGTYNLGPNVYPIRIAGGGVDLICQGTVLEMGVIEIEQPVFTMKGCTFEGPGVGGDHFYAISIDEGRYNILLEDNQISDYSKALKVYVNQDVHLKNNRFIDNFGYNGGSNAHHAISVLNSEVFFEGNEITNNKEGILLRDTEDGASEITMSGNIIDSYAGTAGRSDVYCWGTGGWPPEPTIINIDDYGDNTCEEENCENLDCLDPVPLREGGFLIAFTEWIRNIF